LLREGQTVTRHRQWHVSGWLAVLLVPIALPVALLIQAFVSVFGLKRTADLSAADVVGYIEDFLGDRGGDWDWDDFTSIPITDPRLEGIRRQAELVHLPLDDAGRTKLAALLAQAKALEPLLKDPT
jgi:hypothetical protein